MATGDRSIKQKATDIVRHFSDTKSAGHPICGTKNYGYSSTDVNDVCCKKCKKLLEKNKR